MEKDLLDTIASKLNEISLYNLKAIKDTASFRNCIEQIPTNTYPQAEWAECANYIYETKKEFATAEEAKQFLMRKGR